MDCKRMLVLLRSATQILIPLHDSLSTTTQIHMKDHLLDSCKDQALGCNVLGSGKALLELILGECTCDLDGLFIKGDIVSVCQTVYGIYCNSVLFRTLISYAAVRTKIKRTNIFQQ